jgi:glycosyltransferase involved in cell wall biosynthesis
MVMKEIANIPLISIIVAVLDGAEKIEHCIDSVSRQTYANIELVIMDGGSTDGTVEILKQNTSKIKYWDSAKDKGVYHAWNKALDHISGEWVIFLGADDFLWSDDAIEQLVSHLVKTQKSNRIVYCQMVMVDTAGAILAVSGLPWERIKKKFPEVMGIPHPATVYNRTAFHIHGKFDESFRIAGDFEFLLRELISADALFIPNLILTGMHYGGISSNPENSLHMLEEMRIAQKKHGQRIAGLYWMTSLVKARLRLFLWNSVGKEKAVKILDWGRFLSGKKPFWTRI